jgi:hypothetical protein
VSVGRREELVWKRRTAAHHGAHLDCKVVSTSSDERMRGIELRLSKVEGPWAPAGIELTGTGMLTG